MNKPRYFLDNIVRPNVDAFSKEPHDERQAANAIMTLDAFFGILFQSLKDDAHSAVEDIAEDRLYRDAIADRLQAYKIVRDTAFSLKHGKLRGTTRLVFSAEQIEARAIGAGEFEAGHDPIGGKAVFIELRDGAIVRAEDIIPEVMQEAEARLEDPAI